MVGLILDWDYIQHMAFGKEGQFNKFLIEYFHSRNLCGITRLDEIDWNMIIHWDGLIYSRHLYETIKRLGFTHKYILSFGLPEQRYAGPFRAIGNVYEVEVNEWPNEDGTTSIDFVVYNKKKKVVECGFLLVDDMPPESAHNFLEPKLFTIIRTSTEDTLDILVDKLLVNWEVEEWMEA